MAIPQQTVAQNAVPTVDGSAGPCWVEFTVTDMDGKLVYNAQIRVHFDYGFLGARQLDLQVATGKNGKARFVGLPDSTDGALFFEASSAGLKGVGIDNPGTECHARHGIYLLKPSPTENAAE